jgi:hypothetical protein
MPKIWNTIKQRKADLHERIRPEYLFIYTTIFKNPIGEPNLDPYTVEQIKKRLKIYFDSWVKEEAEHFLLPKPQPDEPYPQADTHPNLSV